jgi:hypothetical protein
MPAHYRYAKLNELLDRDKNKPAVALVNPVVLHDERLVTQQGVFLCSLSRDELFDVALFQMLIDSSPKDRSLKS